jgi:hypothetical protein
VTPQAAQDEAWDASGQDLFDYAEAIGFASLEGERFYPFLVLWLETDDIKAYGESQPATVGRFLTGGVGSDEEEYLAQLASASLRHRSGEHVLMRWTNALVMYSVNAEESDIASTRVLQVFEYLILRRRQLRSLVSRSDMVLRRVTLSRPHRLLSANRVIRDFSALEASLITIPAQSMDASELLVDASNAFGLDNLLDESRHGVEFLERRLQWVKAQWLFILGLAVFTINTVLTLAKMYRP